MKFFLIKKRLSWSSPYVLLGPKMDIVIISSWNTKHRNGFLNYVLYDSQGWSANSIFTILPSLRTRARSTSNGAGTLPKCYKPAFSICKGVGLQYLFPWHRFDVALVGCYHHLLILLFAFGLENYSLWWSRWWWYGKYHCCSTSISWCCWSQ